MLLFLNLDYCRYKSKIFTDRKQLRSASFSSNHKTSTSSHETWLKIPASQTKYNYKNIELNYLKKCPFEQFLCRRQTLKWGMKNNTVHNVSFQMNCKFNAI